MSLRPLAFILSALGGHETSALRQARVEDQSWPWPPSVAILIVGRTLDPTTFGSSSSMAATKDWNMIDRMTGEEESPTSPVLASARKPQHSPWRSFSLSVLAPLAAQLGRSPAVFACTDQVVGSKPKEVTQVFAIRAPNQFDRAHVCYESVAATRRYDLYVKVRPDLYYLGNFPDVRGMRRDYLYTRFRSAQGIAGLTSEIFAWDRCAPRCSGSPQNSTGYVNDDMIMVVPSSLAKRVFMSEAEGSARLKAYGSKDPQGWPTTPSFAEGLLTRKLISAGILTQPLRVLGYPLSSRYSHEHDALACATSVVHKKCGVSLPMETVHMLLRRSPLFNVKV